MWSGVRDRDTEMVNLDTMDNKKQRVTIDCAVTDGVLSRNKMGDTVGPNSLSPHDPNVT
mgnify:CR=1 FL=1